MNGTGHEIDPPLSRGERLAVTLGSLAVGAIIWWMVWRVGELLVFGGP